MHAVVNRITPVHRGRVFQLVTENITLSSGVTVDVDVIRHPGAAAMVPLLDPKTDVFCIIARPLWSYLVTYMCPLVSLSNSAPMTGDTPFGITPL